MPTAKTQSQKAPRKSSGQASGRQSSALKTSSELSEQVLEQLQTGQRSAIAAVRRFMDSTDSALPSLGGGPSRPHEIVDSALEMSERLVEVQYDFLRGVVHSAGEALSGSNATKE
jgi:hypothetical protein